MKRGDTRAPLKEPSRPAMRSRKLPNRLLRYRWRAGEEDRDESGRELDSVVTFELTNIPSGGTHLRVEHRLLVAAPVISLFAARREPTACVFGTSMFALRRAA